MLGCARGWWIGPGSLWMAGVLGLLLVLTEPGAGTRAIAGRPDIYYIWRDGVRLADGENPYAYDHPLEPDERPTKHPSYLPLFYVAVAAVHRLGVREYRTWIILWRALQIVTHAVITLLLYLAGRRAGRPLWGLFGALFWSLNRWTLYVMRSGGLDELALLFLLLSLQCFPRFRRLAFLLFGTSVGIKHIGLLLAPLYLVWTWQEAPTASRIPRWTKLGHAAVWTALIPAAVSLPFLWWDAEAFTRSILSSVIRPAGGPLHVSAVGSVLGLQGGIARIPLLLLLMLVVVLAAHWPMIGRYMAVLLTFAVFTDFNTVLMPQYFA
jgi:hypothetical protein